MQDQLKRNAVCAFKRKDAGEDGLPVGCYSGVVLVASFAASRSRPLLALLRQVAEQNLSRFEARLPCRRTCSSAAQGDQELLAVGASLHRHGEWQGSGGPSTTFSAEVALALIAGRGRMRVICIPVGWRSGRWHSKMLKLTNCWSNVTGAAAFCHRYCGFKMELHHIESRSKSQNDSIENAIPLCFECHAEVQLYNNLGCGRSFRQ